MKASRVLPLIVIPAVVLLGGGLVATQAADPFVAGQRSTAEQAHAPDRAAAIAERARAVGQAVGFPTGAVRTSRVIDRFEGREIDRAAFTAPDGRELALVEFVDDRLTLALRLGTGPGNAKSVGKDRAGGLALGFARRLGADPAGSPLLDTSPSIGGWSVYWPRMMDGLPVRGDGVRVGIGTDGSFDSFSRWEHQLADRPAVIADEASARLAAERWVAARYAERAADYALSAASLAWVAPNDTWDPTLPDAPGPVRRLAWVVQADAVDPDRAPTRAIQVWLDAADLSVVGGDVAL